MIGSSDRRCLTSAVCHTGYALADDGVNCTFVCSDTQYYDPEIS